MSAAGRPAINTLSASRTRVIPKSIDFGALTLNLERAAARADRNSGSDPNGKRQFQPNRTSTLLDRLASRPAESQPRADFRRQPAQSFRPTRQTPSSSAAALDDTSRGKLNASRARFFKVPDLTDVSGPGAGSRSPPPRSSEYIREISSLDKLAAESGIDSSTSGIRARRSYKDRLGMRPAVVSSPPATRFALPRVPRKFGARAGGGGRGGGGGGPRSVGGNNSSDAPIRQSKAKESEILRQSALKARDLAPRPVAVPYDYRSLTPDTFSPILSAVHAVGSRRSYADAVSMCRDDRDAVRLVAGNRSIVRKQTVLKKIESWIPEEAGAKGAEGGRVRA